MAGSKQTLSDQDGVRVFMHMACACQELGGRMFSPCSAAVKGSLFSRFPGAAQVGVASDSCDAGAQALETSPDTLPA